MNRAAKQKRLTAARCTIWALNEINVMNESAVIIVFTAITALVAAILTHSLYHGLCEVSIPAKVR